MTLQDFDTQQLINELQDRGFTVLTEDDVDEVNRDIEGGELLADLVSALDRAITLEDGKLQLQLIDALILATTGKENPTAFIISEEDIAA